MNPLRLHHILEHNSGLLIFGILAVSSIGGLVQVLPTIADQSLATPAANVVPHSPLELVGRDIYIREGCSTCHSQQVRPLLAEVVKSVYSIEIVESLGRDAAARLANLGYRNVEVRIGDGYKGWPEKAPFDGIIVTAAAPYVPAPLVAQLKPGGKMVIPVDAGILHQDLLLIEKQADGTTSRRVVLRVRFVPLTGPGVREGASGRK